MVNTKSYLNRKGRSYTQRRVSIYPIRQRFLIVCEGEKTEPNYFRKFRVPSLIVDVKGLGTDTVRIVEDAIEIKNDDDYDQTWCVFDKDDFPVMNFNEALDLARRNGISVAYSNQSFELWYLLHFDLVHSAITRSQYMRILNSKLDHKYCKNSLTIYDELITRQSTAIRNAKSLLSEYHPLNPAKDDPSTTVHLLVEELIQYSKPYGEANF